LFLRHNKPQDKQKLDNTLIVKYSNVNALLGRRFNYLNTRRCFTGLGGFIFRIDNSKIASKRQWPDSGQLPMNGRRAYKSDVSFLEKISLGAVGTRKVFQDVAAQGHYPIELERGSMNFKIWKRIKIKRVRVPDILCIQCGKRVESRAKTSLEITMSHSTSTLERGWDFGLEENDYIALVKCIRSGEKPIDWVAEEPVQYVQVGNMREAYGKGLAFSEKPKGAGEGFEIRVTWPSSLARDDGEVISVDSKRIQYRNSKSGRVVTLRLSKRGVLLEPRVRVGEAVRKNQIIASVVPVVQRFDCDKTASGENYLSMLDSASLSDRYVSAKALAYFPSDNVADALTRVVRNDREHIYVRRKPVGVCDSTG